IERIVERAAGRGQEIPVVPMALRNMWASMWSRRGAGAGSPGRMRLPRRLRARIGVAAGPPVTGAEATAATLESEVRKLRGNHPSARAMRAKPRESRLVPGLGQPAGNRHRWRQLDLALAAQRGAVLLAAEPAHRLQ